MAYRYYITIEQHSVTADGYGERDKTWTTYKNAWAEMDDSGGVLTYDTDMPVYTGMRTFRIHSYDAPLVTTKMRINYSDNSVTVYYYIRNIVREGRFHFVLTGEAMDDE